MQQRDLDSAMTPNICCLDQEFDNGCQLLGGCRRKRASGEETLMQWKNKTAVILLLAFSSAVHGAELKPETAHAWEDYLARANARMMDRTRGNFLWVDES